MHSLSSALLPAASEMGSMIGVRVRITRLVDDAFPAWVECLLVDAAGKEWRFVEKLLVVCAADVRDLRELPEFGMIGCEILAEAPSGAPDPVTIDTERPWHIAATTGDTVFTVRRDQLEDIGLSPEA